ncbi:MAG: beta-propeller fold lactonase family protein [Deltaproteobacteria bacterium]|nr:beta-propeller fold lactonase family protein [Deltaproteobacteria bacterium]
MNRIPGPTDIRVRRLGQRLVLVATAILVAPTCTCRTNPLGPSMRLTIVLPAGLWTSTAQSIGSVEIWFDNFSVGTPFASATAPTAQTSLDGLAYNYQVADVDGDGALEYRIAVPSNPFGTERSRTIRVSGDAAWGVFDIKVAAYQRDGNAVIATGKASTDEAGRAITFASSASVRVELECEPLLNCPKSVDGGPPDLDGGGEEGDLIVIWDLSQNGVSPMSAEVRASLDRFELVIDEADAGPVFSTAVPRIVVRTFDGIAFEREVADVDGDGLLEYRVGLLQNPFVNTLTWPIAFRGRGQLPAFVLRGRLASNDGGAVVAEVTTSMDGGAASFQFTAASQVVYLRFVCVSGGVCGADAGADAGADTTAPTSVITEVAPGVIDASAIVTDASIAVPYGTFVTVSGTATDDLSGIALVDVSINNGATWFTADGGAIWSTGFFATAFQYVVRSRARDVAGNVEPVTSRFVVNSTQTPAGALLGQVGFDAGCGYKTDHTFDTPQDVAVDPVGARLFVADRQGDRVLVFPLDLATMNPTSLIAINVLGRYTFNDCMHPSLDRALVNPNGLAVDSVRGLLFVSDAYRHRVVIHETAALTSGQAAKSVLGQADLFSSGVGTSATRMNGPSGLSYDPGSQRLFVADQYNNRILVFDLTEIDAGEPATNVLGQPDFTSSSSDAGDRAMWYPQDVEFSPRDQRLFVADKYNHRVLIFDLDGGVTNGQSAIGVLGQPDFTTTTYGTTDKQMIQPAGLAREADGGRLFVSEEGNHRVTVFNVQTIVNGADASAVLGQPNFTSTGGLLWSPEFMRGPGGLAYTAQGEKLFVASRLEGRILLFDVAAISNGEAAIGVLGQTDVDGGAVFNRGCLGAAQDVSFQSVSGVAHDPVNHRLFVGDGSLNKRVLVFNLDAVNDRPTDMFADYVIGQPDFLACTLGTWDDRRFWGNVGSGGIVYDPVTTRLFVSDGMRVMVFHAGATMTSGMDAGFVIGQPDFSTQSDSVTAHGLSVNGAKGLALDSARNRLFVADEWANRVLVYDLAGLRNGMDAGAVLGQVDFTSSTASIDGGDSKFKQPTALAFDSATSRLFVVDTFNYRIMVFDVDGGITNGQAAISVIGQPDFGGTSLGVSASRFTNPAGIAVDPVRQRLYLSDYARRVLVFDVTTITNGMSAQNSLGSADFGWGGQGPSQSLFYSAGDLALTPTGNQLFVTDRAPANRVLFFDVGTP